MTRLKVLLLGILSILLVGSFINGFSFLLPGGVQFNNETQLEQEGFVTRLNKVVYLGDEKVIFEKVAFDRNSMTFIYKGGNILLPASSFTVKGSEGGNNRNILEHTNESTTCFRLTTRGNSYGSVTVPYSLKFINQKITIEINFNGENTKFDIYFPGEKISRATDDVMFDSSGKITNEVTKAQDRVIVGLGCTIMQSKGNDKFMIIDKEAKKVLGYSHASYTTGESITMFDPILFPRKQIKIKVLPEEKIVLISNR
jgi:hypothetical protein